MRQFAHPEEALLRHALGRSIEARSIEGRSPEVRSIEAHSAKAPSIEMRMLTWTHFPPDQPVAAWLRFRAHRNASMALAI